MTGCDGGPEETYNTTTWDNGDTGGYTGGNTGDNTGGGITVPSAPTGVTAFGRSSSTIYVGWNSVSGATGYYIYRGSSSSGTYSYCGTSTLTYYIDTGLLAGTRYYYRVSAYNSYGEGFQSVYDYGMTDYSSGGGGTVPSAPAGKKYRVNVLISTSTSYNSDWFDVSANQTVTVRFTGTSLVIQ